MSTDLIAHAGIALIALGLAAVVAVVGSTQPAQGPRLGLRGLRRQQALDEGGLFALIDPVIRVVAGLVAFFPLPRLRRALESRLTRSGDLLGLSVDEHVALSLVSGLGMLLVALALRDLIGTSVLVLAPIAIAGVMLPNLRLTAEIERRQKLIDRALPVTIDLAALCMGAGLDFPGAMRQILEKALAPDEPLHGEIARIVQVLELGRTRREALEGFAERVPTLAVRDFVTAVIQAEEKGNPLSSVLKIQARMLRMRRSVEAEEAASRAGVMMLLPLMLIFGSILLVLLGPFIINGMKSGF
jgi:tight adherence protein C